MSKIKKPIVWEGDNDMMIPYQGVAMNGQEIELDEDIAEEFAGSNKGRELTDEEKAVSPGWQRYLKAKGLDNPGQGGGTPPGLDNNPNNGGND